MKPELHPELPGRLRALLSWRAATLILLAWCLWVGIPAAWATYTSNPEARSRILAYENPPGTLNEVAPATPLPVQIPAAFPGPVDLVRVGGAATSLGTKVAASSLPVTLASDGLGVLATPLRTDPTGSTTQPVQDGAVILGVRQALTGVHNGAVVARDVALYDETGAAYSSSNTLPTTMYASSGDELTSTSGPGSVISLDVTWAQASSGNYLYPPRMVDGDTGAGVADRLPVLLQVPAAGGPTGVDTGNGALSDATLRATLATNSPGVASLTTIAGWTAGVGATAGATTLNTYQAGTAAAACVPVDVHGADHAVVAAVPGRRGIECCNEDPTADGAVRLQSAGTSANGRLLDAPPAAGKQGGCWVWPTAGAITGEVVTGGTTVTVNCCPY